MTFDVEKARAERHAQQTDKPFTFTLDGREWELIHPGNTPAGMWNWSLAEWSANFSSLVVPQFDAGVEVPFPFDLLERDDMNALVRAWFHGSPGE